MANSRVKKLSEILRPPLAYTGIYPPSSLGNPLIDRISLRGSIIMFIMPVYITLSTCFFVFEPITFQTFADCFWITTTETIMFYVGATLIVKSKNVFGLIDNFEKIIEQRMKEDQKPKKIFGDALELSEEITQMFAFALLKFTLPGTMLPNLVFSLLDYYSNDLGEKAFVLPFPVWMPFNYESLTGYCFAYLIQLSGICCIILTALSNFSFIVVSIVILMAIARDITSKSNALTESFHTHPNGEKLYNQVSSLVLLHTKALQLVHDFAKIYDFYITACFLWCLSTICSSLLIVQLQMAHGSGSLFVMIRPVILGFWSFCTLFVLCRCGEMVSIRFDENNDAICQGEWYKFPTKTQKVLPMIMKSTQQPVIIRGFMNLELTHDSFKAVVNKGFSMFMVFGELAS